MLEEISKRAIACCSPNNPPAPVIKEWLFFKLNFFSIIKYI